MSVGEYGM